jgi:tetratricopeptide (TPR) repeat protein
MKERVADCGRLIPQLPVEVTAQAKEIGRERYVAACGALIYDEVERHIAQGRYPLAEETLRYLAEVAPSAKTNACLGDLYRARGQAGDMEKARTAYEQALGADTRCGAAHRGLGLLLAKTDDKAGAVTHLQQYLATAASAKDAAYIQQYLDQLSKAN